MHCRSCSHDTSMTRVLRKIGNGGVQIITSFSVQSSPTKHSYVSILMKDTGVAWKRNEKVNQESRNHNVGCTNKDLINTALYLERRTLESKGDANEIK